jgi:hypothetical protein
VIDKIPALVLIAVGVSGEQPRRVLFGERLASALVRGEQQDLGLTTPIVRIQGRVFVISGEMFQQHADFFTPTNVKLDNDFRGNVSTSDNIKTGFNASLNRHNSRLQNEDKGQ